MFFDNKPVLTKEQQAQIIAAIEEAEMQTSGEIKVHLEPYCKTDPMQRGRQVFNELELYHTQQRNGVLFYMAFEDHKFAILGDKGIHEKVGQGFWDSTKELMGNHFKVGELAEGLSEGIKMAGQQLKTHFPYQSDDKNELSNDISFGGRHA
jgi:uncharacterized membrane protein